MPNVPILKNAFEMTSLEGTPTAPPGTAEPQRSGSPAPMMEMAEVPGRRRCGGCVSLHGGIFACSYLVRSSSSHVGISDACVGNTKEVFSVRRLRKRRSYLVHNADDICCAVSDSGNLCSALLNFLARCRRTTRRPARCSPCTRSASASRTSSGARLGLQRTAETRARLPGECPR